MLVYKIKEENHNRPRGSHKRGRKDDGNSLSDFRFEIREIFCKPCVYRCFGRTLIKKMTFGIFISLLRLLLVFLCFGVTNGVTTFGIGVTIFVKVYVINSSLQ